MNWFCQTTKRWKTAGYGSSGVILWTNMATTGTNRGRFLLWHVKGKQLARIYINSNALWRLINVTNLFQLKNEKKSNLDGLRTSGVVYEI